MPVRPCNHQWMYEGMNTTRQTFVKPVPVRSPAGDVIGTACGMCSHSLSSYTPATPKAKRSPPENLLIPGANKR